MKIRRRDFLKLSVAAGAATTLGRPALNAFATEIKADVPNRHSKQNDGIVCPRSHLSLQQLYDPDRVKVPMKRTNPKKGRGIDPKFVPISWDEALNTVADKMMELRKAGEPEKFALMRGRYTYMRDTLY
ncbi:MAG: molybdopterin-dependent oxidoreductase, partial [Desulfurivibrionaceae bacterium]